MQLDFTGKVIIVTGAARGIGKCYVEFLAQRGARLVVADIGCSTDGEGQATEPGEAVVSQIRSGGGQAVNVTASVATPKGAGSIIAAALEAFGRIDGLVNNAGIIRMGTFPETSIETYRRHMDVHFFGTVLMSQAAWPHLTRTAGRIVNTISPSVTGAFDMIHYASAKGAIYAFTRNLAAVGANAGLKVNAVSPAAETRMIDVPGMEDALPPGTIDFLRLQMSPKWIAPVTAFLLHESCQLNGEVLSVAGGHVSRLVMMNSPGIASETLSPEEVAARIDEIMDTSKAEPVPIGAR